VAIGEAIMNAQEVGSEQADVGTGDGVVAHPGERFPKDLGPIVTLAAVQRYIDAERQRNRRVLGLAGVAFACLALLVLVLVVSIGIFVLGNTRKATRMVEAVQAQSVAGATELVDMSARVNEVVDGQRKLAETITQERAERAQERQTVKGDMDRVGEWVREGDTREKRALAALRPACRPWRQPAPRKTARWRRCGHSIKRWHRPSRRARRPRRPAFRVRCRSPPFRSRP